MRATVAGIVLGLLALNIGSAPAAAALANDTAANVASLGSLPVSLTLDLTMAVTSTPARTGCYRDVFYQLPTPRSNTVKVTVNSGGRVLIFPTATTVGWETATTYAEVTSTSILNRWTSPVLMVVCSTAAAGQSVSVNIEGDLPAPSISSLTAGNTSLTVTWASNGSGEALLTGFVVMYRTPSSSWLSSVEYPTTATSATITGLSSQTSYEVMVSARSITGTANNSASLSRVTGRPSSSPALSVEREIGGLRVSWVAASEPELTSGISLSVICTGRAAITRLVSGTAAGSSRFGGLDPTTGCAVSGAWKGAYGYDGPKYDYPSAVAPLPYPGLASASFVREGGRSLLRWGAPTSALPSGISISGYVISVSCSNPSFSLSSTTVSAGVTSYANTGIQLGATCSGSVQPKYLDENNANWVGTASNIASQRIVEAPANPSLVSTAGTSTALVFRLSVPTSFGREPDEVTVTQTYNGSTVNTYKVNIAESAVTVPVSDAQYGQLHEFALVSKNAAGPSATARWQQMMPSRAETPSKANVSTVTGPNAAGVLQLNVTVSLDGSRPWMRDNLAKLNVTFVNAVTGEQRSQSFPVSGTTKIDELLPYSPSNQVQVSVQTLLGTSEPLTLKVGSEEVVAPSFGSVRNAEARALTLVWDKTGQSDANLIRIETYADGTLQSATYAPAGSGSSVIDRLNPETTYTFALFLLDTTRGLHSWRPLVISGTTTKVQKPTVPNGGNSSGSSAGGTAPAKPKPSTSAAKPKPGSTGSVKVTAKITLKKTITCVKGSQRKTVTSATPTCPVGWKKQ